MWYKIIKVSKFSVWTKFSYKLNLDANLANQMNLIIEIKFMIMEWLSITIHNECVSII